MIWDLNDNSYYPIGTFVQMVVCPFEVQNLENRLRLMIMSHRRIKIVNQIFDANSKVEHDTKNIFNYCICISSK